jgi:tyrosyl-tRNA synthetase
MPFDLSTLEARLLAPPPDLSHLSAEEQMALIEEKAAPGESIVTKGRLLKRLKDSVAAKKPLRFKLGIDATMSSLHLGHAIPLINLRRIMKMGHEVDLIFGDFTAMIGDSGGRMEERPALTAEQVKVNVATFGEQASKVLDLKAKGLTVHYNSTWLGKLTLADWVKVTKGIGINALMQREDFRKRIEAGLPLSLAEASYALLMGYDSMVLKTDVEVGGMDQFLNFHFCRNMMEASGQEPESFVCFDLLPGTTGERDEQGRLKKMSKTGGNHIPVLAEPADHYGKVMSVPDDVMWVWFQGLTEIRTPELAALKADVAEGRLHPKDAKRLLARVVVATFHHYDAAVVSAAQAAYDQKFGANKVLVPDDVVEITRDPTGTVLDCLKLASKESASQLRRLVQQKGIQILRGEEYIALDEGFLAKGGAELHQMVIKIGKRNYFRFD